MKKSIEQNPPIFALPERKNPMPLALYKRISPHNPRALVSIFNTFPLIYEGKLAQTIRERKLAAIRENTLWIKCLESLELVGVYVGLHFREIAQILGVKAETAKTACLRAELEIYRIFGIHIGFFDKNGVWRLGTDTDAAKKYNDNLKSIVAFAGRSAIYVACAAQFGTPAGQIQAPLFELPSGLSDDAIEA